MTHLGIDVSSNNHPANAAIDYAAAFGQLSAQGGGDQPFVFVKATEGLSYVNPYFPADVAGFRAAGFAVAAYLFDHGSADPAEQQASFRAVAAGLPESLDVEAPDGLDAVSYGVHAAAALGLVPVSMLYLTVGELETLPGAPWGHPVWLADPAHPTAPSAPCTIHQFGTITLSGLVGPVDGDRWIGDEGSFDAFFAGQPLPPIPTPVPAPGPTDPLEAAVMNFPPVSQSSSGPPVVKVQGLLNAFGYKLTQDGVAGPQTIASVRDFQGKHGLSVDGVVGPETLSSLLTS